MRTEFEQVGAWLFCVVALAMNSSVSLATATEDSADSGSHKTSIPWSQIGGKAGADYRSERLAGITTSATFDGARLRCAFQRLQGEATREGLWLTSTVTNELNDRFRVVAVAVGRSAAEAALPCTGAVRLDGQAALFIRATLVEEYSVSMDGVRQDFVVLERPAGTGDMRLRLAVSGARLEPAVFGAQLVLENSGRRIAYSRLRATDAAGKELSARMEVESGFVLAVLLNDADAVYPILIDPTFSDANWISMGGFPGANSGARAAAVDASGNLYIGGIFTIVGDVNANRIAKWDGSSWSALGSGINGSVYALAVSGTNLYAAGVFTAAGGSAATNVAKWNGSSWSALGSGVSDVFGGQAIVWALAVSGTNLYAGGYFTSAGGGGANSIAKWDGSSWSALGAGVSDAFGRAASVYALAASGSNVYVGGDFTRAGGNPATNVARWNGSTWSPLGSGINSNVLALAVSGTNVYAGGRFARAGSSAATNIAKWNGSAWSALGSGMTGSIGGAIPVVLALAVSGTNLYAGGYFASAGGSAANSIAKWDGSSWSPVGSGIDGFVHALAASGNALYAGGDFISAGGSAANYIAKWNGSAWSGVRRTSGLLGFNGRILALAVSGTDVYAGGDFTTAGGTLANRIAKWDGNAWSALGSGMNGTVYILVASGTNLYAGGSFTNAGGNEANRIAKWDGNTWSALGSGMNDTVEALAASGTNLYAGGWFTMADGSAVNYIAKWNGSQWSALGPGMTGAPSTVVFALAVSGSDLYAGGRFTRAGGSVATNIAKWNGSAWSGVGQGIIGEVYSLLAYGTELYAGGLFSTLGGAPGNGIAKWNGSTWLALGSGMNNLVDALAVFGQDLYAGGYFTTAGGTVVNHIAKWDGNAWSALGSGMNDNVYALAESGATLYAGGQFTMAGNKVSAYAASASLGELGLRGVTLIEGNTGMTDARIEILLSSNHTEAVSVDYTTADNEAIAGVDYVPRNGTLVFLPGETMQTIMVPVFGDFDDESTETFYLRLSNPTNITLTVTQGIVTIGDDDTALAITQHPTNQAVLLGSNAIFTVSAISSLPTAYQWRFNGTNIPGATNSSIVISNVQFANEGSYCAVVSDALSLLTSSDAMLTVLVLPLLVAPVPPVSLGAVPGEQVTLGVQVAGTLPIFCRWRVFRATGGNEVLSEQFLTQRLSFLSFTAASNRSGSYVVHLTNAAGGPLTQLWTNAFLALLADSDADGLPDVWELAHPTASDPASDSDNDGLTNLEEYRAGTNPTNAASVLKFDSIQLVGPAGDLLTLSFNAISNKSYTLQSRAALSSGSWSNLANILAQSSNRLVTATNPLTRLPGSSYYRLVTPKQ